MSSQLKLKDFDFQLPESLIAQKPLATRDQSKLMVLDRKSGSIKHETFSRLPYLIPQHSLIVFKKETASFPSIILWSYERATNMTGLTTILPSITTALSTILCIPKIPVWGGFKIGVESIEP